MTGSYKYPVLIFAAVIVGYLFAPGPMGTLGASFIKEDRKTGFLSQGKDPDGIYQSDEKVGVAGADTVGEENGLVYFRSITDASKLVPTADFTYRGYILHVSSINSVSKAVTADKEVRTLSSVKCLIVGRVDQ
ncbi:hypothetical protein [Methylocystis parvus]|uniref:hypothetical protein n=1 Tax=Methylocystis parvus TaxID=134 RepID=UPI003C77AACC